MSKNSFEIKVGLAEMLKGGVIMDVTDVDQAKLAEGTQLEEPANYVTRLNELLLELVGCSKSRNEGKLLHIGYA